MFNINIQEKKIDVYKTNKTKRIYTINDISFLFVLNYTESMRMRGDKIIKRAKIEIKYY